MHRVPVEHTDGAGAPAIPVLLTVYAPLDDQGRLVVGGVPAAELADRFGTPLYAYDGDRIAWRWHRLRASLPLGTHVLYSCKANPSVAVLRLLRCLGAGLDACSPGDLAFGRAAGFDDAKISYLASSMTDDEIAALAAAAVAFTADSVDQVARYGDAASGRDIGLRINLGIVAGFHHHLGAGGPTSKFGIRTSEIPAAVEAAAARGLRVTTLHGHLGSEMLDHGPHVRLLQGLLELAVDFPDVTTINLGGGWGTPVQPDAPQYDLIAFGREATVALDAFATRTGRRPTLRVEPGAHLTLEAGFLLTRITEVRREVASGGVVARAQVGVDASTNHLVSVLVYGARHPVWVADRARELHTGRFNVVGNLLQAADVLATDVGLPAPRRGDVLALGACGAYAAWRASAFNERPRPAEVLACGGGATLTRRAETVADLLSFEVLGPTDPG
jgi:diaminopimelate decarboxylase